MGERTLGRESRRRRLPARAATSRTSLAAAFAHEAHVRRDYSAKLLAAYEWGLRRQRAREHLSGLALINALPNLAILEPLFKVGEQDRNLRQTFIEIFTGDAPVYGLLRHPRVLANVLFRT